MKFKIKSRFDDNKTLFTAELGAEFKTASLKVQLGAAAKLAVKNNVNLNHANLRCAILHKANLSSADLSYADLSYADLSYADLSYADLAHANLCNAYLFEANLHKADLNHANLTDAKYVGDFTMPNGMKFSEYLRDVVPALLTAGGKTLAEIIAAKAWKCHSWRNCPMHVAFGIQNLAEGPPLLRARIEEFINYFDAGLIPEPKIEMDIPKVKGQ